MHAALVTSFGAPPRYAVIDQPSATEPDELLIDVLAAGLHPRVRSGAAGSHYASSTALPLVPGIDGVGRLPDGQRVYFLALDSGHGTMAERTLVRREWCVPLPDSAADVVTAAAINPAMSSWVPLQQRVAVRPGDRVLVLGATGSAGRMAVQIARRLGAGWVAAVGRDPARLASLRDLGADALVSLDSDDLASAVLGGAADTDIVIDYLWGPPAEAVLPAVLAARTDPGRPLTWLHIGAIAGPAVSLPSAALRAHNLTITGSGQGSLAAADFLAHIPALVEEIASGALAVDALPLPLAEVESAWSGPASREHRVVFVP
jgi:NADPH:quinone reductase-like Zn-dependent oxidoreductase